MFVRTGLFGLSFSVACSAATLRVANWNMANHPNDSADQADLRLILNYASSTSIDLLTMAETDTASAPDTATVFGSVYGGTYASIVAPADGGGDRTGFVYNTASLSLISTTTVGGGTLKHPSLRAQFRPAGTTGADDFFAYAVHLQSGSSSAYKKTRVNEAVALRADAETLGTANVIIAGDFNWQKADDVSAGVGAYRTLSAPGTGQVTDPLNMVGDWHGNAAYASLFSEDPGTNLDDRFDMQLLSGKLLDGSGLDYVPGSYHVVGNDGTIAPGGVLHATATMSADVVNAFDQFSDHLPVLADYNYALGDPATLYFSGRTSDSLTLPGNYSTSSAGTTSSAFAPGAGTDVYFATSNAVTSNLDTTLDNNLSVRSLTFDSSGSNGMPISIGGTGTLTLTADAGTYTAGTGIVKQAGSPAVTMSAPVSLGNSQSWTNNSSTVLTVSGSVSLGSGTLSLAGSGATTLSGVVQGSGSIAVVGNGTVRLTGPNTYTGTTIVNHPGADLRVSSAAAAPLLSGPGGADIANGQVAFEYTGNSPASTIRALLTSAHASGFQNGQLRSSTADISHGLGYKDNGSTVLVMRTFYGDADLDGGVSIDDFNAMTANFGASDASVWVDGDFDYDGTVSINDFNLLAGNFGQSLPASADWTSLLAFAAANHDLAAFQAVTGVPEPAVIGLAAVAVSLGLRRRARR